MATAQLATNGYRIAKSWQYEDNNSHRDAASDNQSNEPLNNNTLRPILMANYPPVQHYRNRSAFAGLKRDRERVRRKNSALVNPVESQKQPLVLPKSPMAGQTPDWHRKSDDDEMSGGARCCFGFLIFIAQILLHGVLGLVLFWVIQYHSKRPEKPWPFSWRDDPELEFNLHPVLMIAGFIYFMGQAMLMYRTCRCCRRIWSKLLHTTFHLLAAPCIAIGFVAVWDSHVLRTDKDGNPAPIPNFYSLHSWMGLTTMGLFALQFIVGFFSFLLLLCCESATASFRAALVPIHSTFGITTFVMAVATACTGLTEKAFFTLSFFTSQKSTEQDNSVKEPDQYDYYSDEKPTLYKGIADLYTELPNEAIIVNTIAAALVGLAILMPCILKCDSFRKGLENEVDEDDIE